jgi:hypothetical protein
VDADSHFPELLLAVATVDVACRCCTLAIGGGNGGVGQHGGARVGPGRLEVAGGVVELGRGGPGRFASTLAAEEDVGSPSGVFSGEERSGELSLGSAFISSLRLVSFFTVFFRAVGVGSF